MDVHIINSVYVLIDLCVSATPIRILHFYIPFVFMFMYLIFTLVYWAAGGTTPDGGTAIYPIMDWENLQVTLPFVACCAVFSPVMQVRCGMSGVQAGSRFRKPRGSWGWHGGINSTWRLR